MVFRLRLLRSNLRNARNQSAYLQAKAMNNKSCYTDLLDSKKREWRLEKKLKKAMKK
ncbi:MAG: hypothetical protein PHP82_00825 [Candidatus ainarchaeum sp.]|nr:hypothetical protein [Candidatus ainarchaeum sp.]